MVLACDWFLKYAVAQASALAGRGAQVLLLIRAHALEFGGDESERDAALDRARAAGVTVVQLPGRLRDPAAVPAVWRARRQVARFAPDIVHVHDRVDPRMIAVLPRVPAVLTIHDPVEHPGQPTARFVIKRGVLEGSRAHWRRRAAAVIVHSERLKAELALVPGQRCEVIPHGLDVRAQPLAAPPRPTVGFFGRLVAYKGLDVIARAMPLVWDRRPDVHLRVAGTGPQDIRLDDPRARIDRVYLPESEVESFFADTTLLALAYTQASQTGAGSQAVGFGVPVLASRLGGLPDLVLDDSYLVEPGDATSLAEAIVRHIDDGAPVRARVLAEVAAPRSWDACAQRALALYAELSSAAPAGVQTATNRV